MKKIIFSLVMALMTISANAQITWNVRAGGGFLDSPYINLDSPYINNEECTFGSGCFAIVLQENVPLIKRTSKFTFSPTLIADFSSEDFQVSFPLYLGYKIRIGNRTLFFPKIGPMLGFSSYYGDAMLGMSLESAFEIKHFIVAADFNFNFNTGSYSENGVFITAGYKF
ncbi:MAG: hypothetical protein ACI3X7_07260 [Bacteroidaceae bacterium]